MKTIYKKNPRIFLGYLMVCAMLFFSTNTKAQCIPNGNVCICTMIYMPVCGCDGVLYSNDCIANCQGVVSSPAIPDGSGGFLPCATAVNCTVGVTATSTDATSSISSDGTASASLVGPATCATTFLWSNGATTATINYLAAGIYTVYTTDCQGCIDSASVTIGIAPSTCTAAPYYENFDTGFGTWVTANTGTGTYTGWYSGMSTPSFATGPQAGDVTGGNFMYIETSAIGGPYTLTSECIDISALANPSLRFSYHMYGATMGTLDVLIPLQ
jgi:hypothetical protein